MRDGENGVLVDVEDAAALADALVDVLLEPDLGRSSSRRAPPAARADWLATPEEFAERVRDLVASLD